MHEEVIADKIKFSLSLGIPTKAGDEWLKDSVIGLLAGTAIGFGVGGILSIAAAASAMAATAAFAAGLGLFGKIGLVLGLVSIPVTIAAPPIAIPVLAGLGVAIATTAVVRGTKKIRKFTTYSGYKSFNTPLNRLGVTISGLVFVPMAGMALADVPLTEKAVECITNKMLEWGYSSEYIKAFLTDLKGRDMDAIKKYIANLDGFVKARLKRDKRLKNDVSIDELKKKRLQYCKEIYTMQGRPAQGKIILDLLEAGVI